MGLLIISDEIKAKLKKFRFRRANDIACLIFKIDCDDNVSPPTKTLVLDDELNDIENIEDLQEELPDCYPRYVLLSYKIEKSDGRIMYPLCFITYSPESCGVHQCMLYASVVNEVMQEAGMTESIEVRVPDEELVDEWLTSKIMKYKI